MTSDSPVLSVAGEFTAAVESSAPWHAFRLQRAPLPQDAISELKEARAVYWERTTPDVVESEAGPRIIRRAEYLWHGLLGWLDVNARAHWMSCEALDAFLEDLWCLLAHLSLFRTVTPVSRVSSVRLSSEAAFNEVCLPAVPFVFRLEMVIAIPAELPLLPSAARCGAIRFRSPRPSTSALRSRCCPTAGSACCRECLPSSGSTTTRANCVSKSATAPQAAAQRTRSGGVAHDA